MIKFILSDFTGVVVTGGHKKLSQILAERHNLDAGKIYDVLYTKYFNQFALNKITEEEANQGTIDDLGLEGETWQGLVDQYLRTHTINQLMVDYIIELREKYKVVLLTKNIKHYLDWERKEFGLDNIFHDIINTSEINLPKASKDTLNYVLDRYKIKPEEVLYIDDQEDNLKDAREMGVHVVLYQDFNQVKNEFNKILNN